MLKRIKYIVMGGLLVLSCLLIPACVTTEAKPAALTGDEVHERHATGMESQAADM